MIYTIVNPMFLCHSREGGNPLPVISENVLVVMLVSLIISLSSS